MITSETAAAAELHTAPERPARGNTLRLVLVVAVVLLVVGLVVFAGLSGLAADPMAGT
jgi:Tfp pilus assembly protein PilX